jgi:hypothetical protein
MRKAVFRGGFAFLTVLAVGLQAEAAPLEVKQVAANAKWLGHVDFDAIRDSTVVQKGFAAHMEKHPQAKGHLKLVQGLTGIDLCHDLHGLTFYGPEVGKHTGVAILNAKLDRKKLQLWADTIPGRQTTEHGDYKISSWSKKHGDKTCTVASAWHGDNQLVIASSADELKSALDVLDGKSAGIGSDSKLAGNVPAGTTVLMRVTGIAEAKLKHKDPVAKQTESFRFVVGENQGKSFFRARAVMTNKEIVENVKEIAEGGKAVARIASGTNEQKLRLVNGLEIKPDGETLTLVWSGSADDVWQQVEAHAKKWEAMRAKRREHRHHGHAHHHDGDKKADRSEGSKKTAPSADEDF